MVNKIAQLIGLAKKAGKAVCGSGAAVDAVRRRECGVVILAEDASGNTVKRLTDKCTFYQAPCLVWGSKEQLGKAVGAQQTACIAITEQHLAQAIQQKYQEIYGGGNNGETESE